MSATRSPKARKSDDLATPLTVYPVARDGQWITPRRRGYGIECCDCGLIHRLDFRLVPHGGGHRIQFRAYRVTQERSPPSGGGPRRRDERPRHE